MRNVEEEMAEAIMELEKERDAAVFRLKEVQGAIKQHRQATLDPLRLIDPQRAEMMSHDKNLYAVLGL